MAAALQQTPITFQSRSPPTNQISATKVSLSISTGLKLPKLTIKLPTNTHRRRRGNGASGARMAESAAGSYAVALVDVAKSNDTLDQTQSDIEKVERLFSQQEVLNFFANPTIDEKKKRDIIDELAKTKEIQPHVANFLNILVDMKRIDIITEIVKEFELVYNKLTDTEIAIVTSVVHLESKHLAQIAQGIQKLTGAKNVRIKTKIDPSLVAGFTIRYGGTGSKMVDMSVKKQLEEIAAQLDLSDVQLAV